MGGRKPKSESPHREAAAALSDRIRAARASRGWSQQQLAEAASIAYGTVRAIETRVVVDPGVFTVQAIAEALEVDITELVRPRRSKSGGGRSGAHGLG